MLFVCLVMPLKPCGATNHLAFFVASFRYTALALSTAGQQANLASSDRNNGVFFGS
jgi:hypothetical protein